MLTIANFIRKMPENITCPQFCRGVTRAIARCYTPFHLRLTGIISPQDFSPANRLTASAVIFSRLQRQIWMIGDCQCLANGQYYDNPKPAERLLAEHSADIVRRLLSEGKSQQELLDNDIAREAIIPEMLQTMNLQNISYAVIDGTPVPMPHVKVITLDFQPWEIVLASDGYPFLKTTLAQSEEALEQQRVADPLNIGTFKATKGFTPGNNSFDDRSYIRFRI